MRTRARVAAMGRTSGKKPGRYSGSACSSIATAPSRSPRACSSPAMAVYQRCRFSSSDARSPSSRAVCEVLRGRVEVALLAQHVGQPDVQVTGRGQHEPAMPFGRRRAPARTAAAPRPGRPRASHMLARTTVAPSSSAMLPAACRLRDRLAERVDGACRGRRRPRRPGRGTRPRPRGRGGRRARPARRARRACATVPSTSPRAWATDGAVDLDRGRQGPQLLRPGRGPPRPVEPARQPAIAVGAAASPAPVVGGVEPAARPRRGRPRRAAPSP